MHFRFHKKACVEIGNNWCFWLLCWLTCWSVSFQKKCSRKFWPIASGIALSKIKYFCSNFVHCQWTCLYLSYYNRFCLQMYTWFLITFVPLFYQWFDAVFWIRLHAVRCLFVSTVPPPPPSVPSLYWHFHRPSPVSPCFLKMYVMCDEMMCKCAMLSDLIRAYYGPALFVSMPCCHLFRCVNVVMLLSIVLPKNCRQMVQRRLFLRSEVLLCITTPWGL